MTQRPRIFPEKPSEKAYAWFVERFKGRAAEEYAKHFSKAELKKVLPEPEPEPEEPEKKKEEKPKSEAKPKTEAPKKKTAKKASVKA